MGPLSPIKIIILSFIGIVLLLCLSLALPSLFLFMNVYIELALCSFVLIARNIFSKHGKKAVTDCRRVRRELFWATPRSFLGTPVVPFYPFCLGVSLLKQSSRKKGTLIIWGLLGNLVFKGCFFLTSSESFSPIPTHQTKAVSLDPQT